MPITYRMRFPAEGVPGVPPFPSWIRAFTLEGCLHNFTIHEVADKAGISYHTVNRYFESRKTIGPHVPYENDGYCAESTVSLLFWV